MFSTEKFIGLYTTTADVISCQSHPRSLRYD